MVVEICSKLEFDCCFKIFVFDIVERWNSTAFKLKFTGNFTKYFALVKKFQHSFRRSQNPQNPKNYRPISLLYVSYEILERLIHVRVEPNIDSALLVEQAELCRRKSTVDQAILTTQNIKDYSEVKIKAGAVFVDLKADYDTVWHCGLNCKILRILQDVHIIRIIMELVRNKRLTLTTGGGKQSRLRRLKKSIPEELVLAPAVQHLYS